jgi:isopropylmalate/homocitrate/citramalate synthase
VYLWAQQMGIDLNDDEAMEVLQRVKDRATEMKRLLSEDEFKGIAREVKAGR